MQRRPVSVCKREVWHNIISDWWEEKKDYFTNLDMHNNVATRHQKRNPMSQAARLVAHMVLWCIYITGEWSSSSCILQNFQCLPSCLATFRPIVFIDTKKELVDINSEQITKNLIPGNMVVNNLIHKNRKNWKRVYIFFNYKVIKLTWTLLFLS